MADPGSTFSTLAECLAAAGPAGVSPEDLGRELPDVSRSTLNRRLAQLVHEGVARRVGAGRATRYVSASPLRRADIDAYFRVAAQQRQVAVFKQELLMAQPNIARHKALRCESIQAIATPVDKRFLTNFLVDFSWGSSILEGGSYSALDTQALIQYGQKNRDKPTADALLVLGA